MIKNLSIATLLAVTVVFGVLSFKNPAVVTQTVTRVDTVSVPGTSYGAAPVVNVPAPVVNVAAPNVTVAAPAYPTSQNANLSSVTGPDFYGTYFAVNDLKHFPVSKPFRWTAGNGTTTVCAIKAPASTSTLSYASVAITVGTSTATTWTIATSSTAFATTTKVASGDVGAGNNAYLPWFPVSAGTVFGGTVAPNSYLVFGVQGGTGSGTTGVVVSGSCSADFVQL